MSLSVTPAVAEPSLNELVQNVTTTANKVTELEQTMGSLQEEANKALVDVRDAQTEAERARRAVEAAEQLFEDSQKALEAAQAELNDLAAALYRQGGSTGFLAGSSSQKDNLDRSSYLREKVEKQKATVEKLERTRTENANKASLLREARDNAEKSEQEAVDAEANTRSVIASNEAELDRLREEHSSSHQAYDTAVKQLDEARGTSDPQEDAPAPAESVPDASSESNSDSEVPGADVAQHLSSAVFDHTSIDDPYKSASSKGEESPLAPQFSSSSETTSGDSKSDSASTNSDGVSEALEQITPKTEDTSTPVSGNASQIIETAIARAESQIGTPYVWGGGNANGPTRGLRDGGVADANGDYTQGGFDCSGLVLYAFAGAGIDLPHFTGYQYQRGKHVSPSEMQRGDLIFYGPNGNQHVAIYLGDGMMIEAPNSGASVRVTPVRWDGMSEYAVRLV